MFFDENSANNSRRHLEMQATPPQPISGGLTPDFWLQSPPVQMPWGLPAGVQPPVFGQPSNSLPPNANNTRSSLNPSGSYGSNISTFTFPCKRKMDSDNEMLKSNKLHITEEKMIAQMQALYIEEPPEESIPKPSTSESSETSPRLVFSEELKSVHSETNILPTEILLQRLQPKPSMALMLWEPPHPAFRFKTYKTKNNDTGESSTKNNNNSSLINNEMNQDMETS